jgi:hypothetical protein
MPNLALVLPLAHLLSLAGRRDELYFVKGRGRGEYG